MRYLFFLCLVGCGADVESRTLAGGRDVDEDVDEGVDEGADAGVDAPAPTPPAAPGCACNFSQAHVTRAFYDADGCALWATDLRAAVVAASADAVSVGALAGPVVDGQVAVTLSHDHGFLDGCVWRATETLVGVLDGCELVLDYAYQERAISGTHCAIPCGASGTITILGEK